MPEGDTIFRTATVLRLALSGREVVELRSTVPQIGARASAVAGRTVSAVESRGKNLLITFALGGAAGGAEVAARDPRPSRAADRSGGGQGPGASSVEDLVLHTHLGMHGTWHVYRPGQGWRVAERLARVVIVTEGVVAPCFRPTIATLEPARAVARSPSLRSLGPDAMTPDFDAVEARRRLRNLHELEIGIALLDQRALAGLGNVYKSEVLFARRVSPFARVADLSDEALDGLIAEAHRLLVRNSGGGARRTVPGAGIRDGLWVYRRSGRPCRACRGPLAMTRQGTDGRSTYYCPRCQSAPIGVAAVRRNGRE